MSSGGFPPRPDGHRMIPLTKQILDLQRLPAADLAERYHELFGRAPRVQNAAWLRRQVAWKLQERANGGVSSRSRCRLDELMAQLDLPITTAPLPPKPVPSRPEGSSPAVGTTLVREWHGQTIRVEVRDDGYEWRGSRYRSLSALAKAITGTTWNGRLFFGLSDRRAKS